MINIQLLKKTDKIWFRASRGSFWAIPLFVMVACGGGEGDSSNNKINGIVVNQARFQQGNFGCQLVINATNTTTQRKTVILTYEALDSAGRSIGSAMTSGYSIPANSTQTTNSNTTGNYFLSNDRRLFKSCAGIATIELSIEQSIVNP